MDITTLSQGELHDNYIEGLHEKIRRQQQTIDHEQFQKRKRVEDQDIFQSTKRFKSIEYSDDFRQNLQKLQSKALPPSSASWKLLDTGGVLETFDDFLLQADEKRIEISNIDELDQMECIDGDEFDFIQQKITGLVKRDNEGYSMLKCGNILVHIVDELQRIKKSSKKEYQLTIFSVILENLGDRRRDKISDYVIYKLENKRCLAVIELKLSVGSALGAKQKELSQLFLETHYAHHNDKRNIKYDYQLSILADADNWHLFLVDVRVPLRISKYCFLFQPAIPILCKAIRYFLAQLQ